MSIAETVLEKLNALPPEKQAEVLRFVENVSSPIEPSSKDADPYEWLTIAANMNLDGPAGMSEHLDDYLYGDKKNDL